MNTLYSVLTDGLPASAEWTRYDKLTEPVLVSQHAAELVADILLKAETAADKRRMACVLCGEVTGTCFGKDILKLDPENTYTETGREKDDAPDQTRLDPGKCAFNFTESARSLRRLDKWLDEDIRERLVVPTWFEYMAAACLQLLRMVKKG